MTWHEAAFSVGGAQGSEEDGEDEEGTVSSIH